MGGAWHGHTTTGALCLLGELHIHLSMVLGDQAVVEVIVLDLQEDGFTVYKLPRFQEVHHLGGDEHTVGVYGLHCDEAEEGGKKARRNYLNNTVRIVSRFIFVKVCPLGRKE